MIRLRKAILIIHGFTGSLCDNEYLMNYLEYNPQFDVFAKTLPGHNQERYHNVKYPEWISFVDEEIANLIKHGYQSIYVIGHSMGGILASIAASKYKEVKKLVLINAAFDYINLKQNTKDFLVDKNFQKYDGVLNKFFKTSPRFFLEFSKMVKLSHEIIPNIKCNVLILQSVEDEIVPCETAVYLYDNVSSKIKCLTYLKSCSHVVLRGERKEEVSRYIMSYLKGGLEWKIKKTREL